MDIRDMLICSAFVVFALSAVWGWRKFYEWFVEPAKHHQPPSAPFPSNPYFTQDG